LGGEGASRCEERRCAKLPPSLSLITPRLSVSGHVRISTTAIRCRLWQGRGCQTREAAVVRMVPTDAGLDLRTNEAQIKEYTKCVSNRVQQLEMSAPLSVRACMA